MAIFAPGESRCPLCGEVLYEEDDCVATSHFLFPGHPLVRYSDANMHRTCFLRWEHRAAFVKAYNEEAGGGMRSDGSITLGIRGTLEEWAIVSLLAVERWLRRCFGRRRDEG
jgi:hypothetical protein